MVNTIIFGKTGAGKTTQFVVPMIKRALFADGSVVVTDFGRNLVRCPGMDCVWKLMYKTDLPCRQFDFKTNSVPDEYISDEMFEKPGLTVLNYSMMDNTDASGEIEIVLSESVRIPHDNPITIIIDEAASFGAVHNIDKLIKQARKKDVRVVLVFNDIEQMEKTYPDAWSKILKNMQEQILLPTTDIQTATYFAGYSKDVHATDLLTMKPNTYYYVKDAKAKFKEVS